MGGIERLMEAYNWTSYTNPKGYLLMEKLDGCFAKWTGSQLLSKNGNPIHAPSIAADLPAGVALVGELYAGRGGWERVVSAINGGNWQGVKFIAFDLVDYQLPAIERRAKLDALNVESVPCVICEGKRHLRAFEADMKQAGGEGAMLLRAKSKYIDERSVDLLKVKTADLCEVQVIGWNGKSLDVIHEGRKLKVAIGAKRKHASEKTVFISHYGFTRLGTPRHAAVV